ncbi:hypothetical protein HED50_21110 [Ochrobactrum oryzae]|nr:hypothetical protein [Brucella oryzae]
MRIPTATIITALIIGSVSVSTAQAACEGTNGRGWGTGRGAGQFEMSTRDKICKISFPGFIDDVRKTRTPLLTLQLPDSQKRQGFRGGWSGIDLHAQCRLQG